MTAKQELIYNFTNNAWMNGFSVSRPGVIVAKRGRMEVWFYTNKSDMALAKVLDNRKLVATIKNFTWNRITLTGRRRSSISYAGNHLGHFSKATQSTRDGIMEFENAASPLIINAIEQEV